MTPLLIRGGTVVNADREHRADVLVEHGRISACDINVSFTDIARQSWADAGVAHKISLYLQPALLTATAGAPVASCRSPVAIPA